MNKLEIVIDTDKTLKGSKKFLKKSLWTDYNDTSKILGTKILIGVTDIFSQVTIKVAKDIDKIDFKINEDIEFEDLKGTLYTFKNNILVSWLATDVKSASNFLNV